MDPTPKSKERAATQLAVLYSLLLTHVFVKSAVTLSQVLEHARKMSDGTKKTVEGLIVRFDERNPLLWFKLLVALHQGTYCVETLLREGIISESHMSSGNVRTRLIDRLVTTSPHPLARWLMVEYPQGKTPVKTMLYGADTSLRQLPHVKPNQRLYAVVKRSQSEPIPFQHVTLIKK